MSRGLGLSANSWWWVRTQPMWQAVWESLRSITMARSWIGMLAVLLFTVSFYKGMKYISKCYWMLPFGIFGGLRVSFQFQSYFLKLLVLSCVIATWDDIAYWNVTLDTKWKRKMSVFFFICSLLYTKVWTESRVEIIKKPYDFPQFSFCWWFSYIHKNDDSNESVLFNESETCQ